MTIAIKPTASGSTIEQNGSTILTVDGSGNITPSNNLYPKGPTFAAYLSGGDQSISSTTYTKIEMNSEEWDTDSCYDTTTFRFTPNVAGYYQINLTVRFKGTSTQGYISAIFKNGSETYRIEHDQNTTVGPLRGAAGSALVYLNGSTDYVEAYGWIQATSPSFAYNPAQTRWSGHMVRAA